MKTFSRILVELALLPIAGCIFPDNRDFSDVTDPASASLSGRQKPMRTVEQKRTFKPWLGEIGLKG